MLLDLNPVAYLSAFTGLVVGYFVWRGSGKAWKAVFAAPLTFGILLVVPIIAFFFLAYLAGYPREEYATAWATWWTPATIVALNVAVWAWMAWKRWA